MVLSIPLFAATACAQAANYEGARSPRFSGSYAAAAAPDTPDQALDVVTFNIQFSRRIDLAQELFDSLDELRRADIVLLQEMDAPGVRALAAHLSMSYVYYPALVHPKTQRDFGNAVLSRWPIVSDRKILLPHRGLFDGSQRAATCATLATPVAHVEACSLHLATPLELLPGARRDQLRAVASELGSATHAVVGGDLNGHGLGTIMTREAFEWPTKGIGGTRGAFSLDHIFTRGLRTQTVGKVSDTLGASDHAAVWTRLAWTVCPPRSRQRADVSEGGARVSGDRQRSRDAR